MKRGIEFETRIYMEQRLELREDGDGKPPHLVGYAARFNSKSVDLGGFVEVIQPGAFKRTLAADPDVCAFVNHNEDLMLGRTRAGTVKLLEDERGLKVDITPPPTQAGKDAIENVRLGNYSGMSFAFVAITETWHSKAKPPLRELLDVDLFDVSVVTFPAYPKTEVALRSLAQALAAELEADGGIRRRRLELLELELGLPKRGPVEPTS